MSLRTGLRLSGGQLWAFNSTTPIRLEGPMPSVRFPCAVCFGAVAQTRFWGLFLANIDAFRSDMCRATLFSAQRIRLLQACADISRFLFCGLCGRQPFFLLRPSLFWAFCVKYVVPPAMLMVVAQGKCMHRDHFERLTIVCSPNAV